MESNSLWFDQKVGTVYYDIVNIREMDKPLVETFIFNKVGNCCFVIVIISAIIIIVTYI